MTSQPPQRTWADYFIPGTSVLRNKFTGPGKPYGETDPAKLTVLEEQRTRLRLMELRTSPLPGRFDYDHMKAIHRYIFQDVYEWAGQERTAAAEAEYAKLAEANYLRGLNREAFVAELAERWGELNVVHSFREGNTRSQFVFFSQLCEQAGYRLDTEAFRPANPLRDEFVQARFHSQDTGRNDRLAVVLDKAIGQVAPYPEHDPGEGPQRSTGQASALREASFPQPPRVTNRPVSRPGRRGGHRIDPGRNNEPGMGL